MPHASPAADAGTLAPQPAAVVDPAEPTAHQVLELLVQDFARGVDFPELWPAFPEIVGRYPELPTMVLDCVLQAPSGQLRDLLTIVLAMVQAAYGDVAAALLGLEPLAVAQSQSPLVQGAVFYLQGLQDPDNPKFELKGKICGAPFEQLDVLERSTHLCCASWLQASAGDLSTTAWEDVWNSASAQSIRRSIYDGSYRYCNKTACPRIQANVLDKVEDLAIRSEVWRERLESQRTVLMAGPERVNLAYDRTCNLSCPSCRSEAFAADAPTRARYEAMQNEQILPLLHGAKTVMVTGSGDPFASKNFRRLIEQLGPEDYPDLRFQIMTNAMLLTPREWARFPSLHRRVGLLKVSIDAARGATHERLRRGARWDVMMQNMRFAGELLADGLISRYELVFTVQDDNFHEMAEACDLAREVGASCIWFFRITNWGTFSAEEYRKKAVFLPSHPEHADFLKELTDPRLNDPRVSLGDMEAFLPTPPKWRHVLDPVG